MSVSNDMICQFLSIGFVVVWLRLVEALNEIDDLKTRISRLEEVKRCDSMPTTFR
jgi:hypothetical protein